MLAKVYTCAVVGLDGQLVEVEVDIASGLPAFHVVGLPDTAVHQGSPVSESVPLVSKPRLTISVARRGQLVEF